ncbi:hypothetical protein VHEMI10108 [[Torrubiella] hemipterigena]|uniref:Oxidoreductase NAD-binding domain-containing protein 1 n=1 Tax=[Torrubiella] hemipterigena TaxID=1531966 RepID=A0A0A1THY8_9HYPO|nr:hypothetical protein VHEMI10108 [[Torrubiella] hemipterigena]
MSSKESHLERTALEPRQKNLLDVELSAVSNITNRVRLLRLQLHTPIEFAAGQWLDTYVPGVVKAGGFTIVSQPADALRSVRPYLELAVQDSPGNPAAAWLWRGEAEIIGQTLQVRIGGSFVLPEISLLSSLKRIIFVAAGVGINPLISMLGYLEEQRIPGLEVSLLFGVRVLLGDEILFLDRIAAIFKPGKLRGCVRLFITPPETPATVPAYFHGIDVSLQQRRLTLDDILQELQKSGSVESRAVYLCGPPTMTDDIYAELTAARYADMLHPHNVCIEKWW